MADMEEVGERARGRGGIRVWLSGELDLGCLPELRATLRAALGSRLRVWVDLSGVTFMDALCLRELVVQYLLHFDRLVLWRPSPEVRLTVAICGAEDWVSFYPERAAVARDERRSTRAGEFGGSIERCRPVFARKCRPGPPRGSGRRLPPW